MKNRNEYQSIHVWLKYHYGKATKCELCDGKTPCKRFEWALIKGKPYEKKRENFMQLCGPCHRKYDVTDSFREKCRQAWLGKKPCPQALINSLLKITGVPRTHEVRLKCSRSHGGKPVLQIDMSGKIIKKWETIMDASRALGIRSGNISNVINRRTISAGGFIWKYNDFLNSEYKLKEKV